MRAHKSAAEAADEKKAAPLRASGRDAAVLGHFVYYQNFMITLVYM